MVDSASPSRPSARGAGKVVPGSPATGSAATGKFIDAGSVMVEPLPKRVLLSQALAAGNRGAPGQLEAHAVGPDDDGTADTFWDNALDMAGELCGLSEELIPKKKAEPPVKMVRVGIGKGEYVVDMEHRPPGPGDGRSSPTEQAAGGRWEMSYRYVGPGQGQFSMVRLPPAEVEELRQSRTARLLVPAAVSLGLLVLMVVGLAMFLGFRSWHSSDDAAVVVKHHVEPRPSSSTPEPTPSTTQEVKALDISLRKFAGALDTYWGSPSRAEFELFSNTSKVDFPAFANFSNRLWPPLNATQAWLVFSLIDQNKDLAVQEWEFDKSLRGFFVNVV